MSKSEKYSKVRYHWLRSNTLVNDTKGMDGTKEVAHHPHTCLVVRVSLEDKTISYGIARRESPGGLLWLRKRMQAIRELGGIVPEHMVRMERSFSRDFSKRSARVRACRKLNNNPYVITFVDCTAMSAHEITRLVMQHIVGTVTLQFNQGNLVESVLATAAEAAREWLETNQDKMTTLKMPVATAALLAQELQCG